MRISRHAAVFTLGCLAAAPVAQAQARSQDTGRAVRDDRRAALVHTSRDGFGAGVLLPVGASAALRATAFGSRSGRTVHSGVVCALGPGSPCPTSSYVIDRRVGGALALLVRGEAWGGARLYAGVDAALRYETQRQTAPPLCRDTRLCTDPNVSLSRWTVRPGLVAGAEVPLGARVGAFAEASVAVLRVPRAGSDWREASVQPLRGGFGVRMGW